MFQAKQIFKAISIASFIVIVTSTHDLAAIKTVPAQYATIQLALNACVAGDTILVSSETYTGTGTNIITWPNVNNISLKASTTTSLCTLDGQSARRIINVPYSVNLTIEGFTLANGAATLETGGGIYLKSGTVLYLKNVIIWNCKSPSGGAVYSSGARVKARNCIFNGNSATSGPIPPGAGGVAYLGTWEAVNCVFSLNGAGGESAYGGVAYGGTWNVINCTFFGNSVGGGDGGGGVAYSGTWSGKNCIFNNNSRGGSPTVGGPVFYATSPTSITYSDIQADGWVAGQGNIMLDPNFASTVNSDANFLRLGFASPCIDAGTYEVGVVPSTDADGKKRPHGFAADVGAYEFQGPTLWLLSPNGGQKYLPGDTINITWTATDEYGMTAGPITIRYSADQGATWNFITNEANTGSYNWIAPNARSENCLISIEAVNVNNKANIDTSNSVFQIATLLPQVFISPTGSDSTGDGSSGNPYKTIAKALIFVAEGGSILATPGTYYEYNIPWNKNNITLKPYQNTNACTIDAQGNGRCISAQIPVNLTIEGFTLQNGNYIWNPPSGSRDTSGSTGINLISGSNLWLRNVIIKNCRSYYGGGAVYADGSNVNAENCWFINNYAYINGGVTVNGSYGKWKATNCVFAGNVAGEKGGVFMSSAFEGINCTFYSNSAISGSVGFAVVWKATNSVFWDNSGTPFGNMIVTPEISYSNIQPNGFFAGTGNISVEPLFVSTVTTSENFLRLGAGSPCIDTASKEAPSPDLAGNPRPYGFAPDMGVYEFLGPSVSVLFPNGGETLFVGSHRDIKWLISEEVTGNVSLRLSTNGGFRWTTLITQEPAQQGSSTYDWHVGDLPSNNCLISITAANSSNILGYDTSNRAFEIAYAASMISTEPIPYVYSSYVRNTSTITWEVKDVGNGINNSSIFVKLTTNEGASWTTQSSGNPKGASQATFTSGTFIAPPKCRFRVTASDLYGPPGTVESNSFGVDNKNPSVEVTLPASPYISYNSIVPITLKITDEVGVIKARIKAGTDAAWKPLSLSSLPTTVTIEPSASGTHNITIEVTDLLNNSITITRPLSLIIRTSPLITIEAIPNYVKDSVTVNWQVTNTSSGIDNNSVTVRLTTNEGVSWITQASGSPSGSSIRAFDPGTFFASPKCWFRVTAADPYGTISTAESNKFGVDYKNPSVEVTLPSSPYISSNNIVPITLKITDEVGISLARIKAGQSAPWKTLSLSSLPTTITIEPSSTGTHNITIEVTDTLNNIITITRPLSLIILSPPHITTIPIPYFYSNYVKDSAVITWEITDTGNGIDNTSIVVKFTTNEGASWATQASGSPTGSSLRTFAAGTFFASPKCRFRVSATDLAGAISTAESNSFGVDNKSPSVEVTLPASPYTSFNNIVPITIKITDEVGISLARIKAGTDAAWKPLSLSSLPTTVTIEPSVTGTYNITLEATDLLNNSVTVTKPLSLVIRTFPLITVEAVPNYMNYVKDSATISWQITNPSSGIDNNSITVRLTTNEGASWTVQASGNPSGSSQKAFAPGTFIASPKCWFRVTAADPYGTISTVESNKFGVDYKNPSVSVTLAAQSVKSTVPITIAPTDEAGISNIRVLAGEGASWKTYTPASLPTVVTIEPSANGTHNVTIEVNDLMNNSITITKQLTLNLTSTPEITIRISPFDYPNYYKNTAIISWEVTDSGGDLINSSITLKFTANGSNWVPVSGYQGLANGTFVRTMATGFCFLYPNYRFQVSAADQSGNIATVESASFGFDYKKPRAQVILPSSYNNRTVPITIMPTDEVGLNIVRVKAGEMALWQEYSPKNLIETPITLVPSTQGNHNVTIEVVDLLGNTTTETRSILLTMQNTPEVARILVDGKDISKTRSMKNNSKITALIYDYQGTGLASAEILIISGAQTYSFPTKFTRLADDISVSIATVEAQLPALTGSYTIKIVATDPDGNSAVFESSSMSITYATSITTKPKVVPNPFRPGHGEGTRIIYNLTNNPPIKIIIYDMTGKAVWQKTYNPGENGAKVGLNDPYWDGKTNFEEYASNGVYIFIITADNKVLAKGQMAIID